LEVDLPYFIKSIYRINDERIFCRFRFVLQTRLGFASSQEIVFWNADSTTNLPEWKVDIVHAAKGAFGIYAECLVKLKIPAVWVDEFTMLTEVAWD
jgi:hypothetical protein